MKILSLDSSATSASVCIYDCELNKVIGEFYINTKLTHSQTLLPMIDSLLTCTKLNYDDIDYLAVNTGPGSFTGVRIGVSVVKGIAFAQNKECIALSTLETMAYNLIDMNNVVVCACMDARRNQVYNALFSINNGVVERLCDDRAISIDDLYSQIKSIDKPVFLVGDGAQLCYGLKPEDVDVNIANPCDCYQKASSGALCAANKINNNEQINAQMLMPSYLRLSQAERERQNKIKE